MTENKQRQSEGDGDKEKDRRRENAGTGMPYRDASMTLVATPETEI